MQAIPSTFLIDSDGVLTEEHVGDASTEGRLRKLVARAAERTGKPMPKQAGVVGGEARPGVALGGKR